MWVLWERDEKEKRVGWGKGPKTKRKEERIGSEDVKEENDKRKKRME